MKILKALALGTVPVVGVFLCVLLWQIGAAVDRASSDEVTIARQAAATLGEVNQPCPGAASDSLQCGTLAQLNIELRNLAVATASANATIDNVNAAMKTINQPCGDDKPCGTLADVAKTLNTVRGTFGQIEVAANHEDRNLTTLDVQEATLFADTHSTFADADALMVSPDVAAMFRNANATSASLADSMKQTDAMLADARAEVDKLAHPPVKKLGFWGSVWVAAKVVHRFEPPIF